MADDLHYMGQNSLKAKRVITHWGSEIEVRLFKTPKCAVRGSRHTWISEADRWVSITVFGPSIFNISFSGDNLRQAIARAEKFIDRRNK